MPAVKSKILIVDDDSNIADLISLYLKKEFYDTMIVEDGEAALQAVASYQPDLILLDLMLPGIDGYQVCREVRSSKDTPIIMLSAKGEIFDKVLGLEMGADDYMEKPFDPKELIARVKAVLRRYHKPAADPAAPDEKIVSYPSLTQIWGYDYAGETRTVDVHIKRIREKIHDTADWRIATIYGIGYKFDTSPQRR